MRDGFQGLKKTLQEFLYQDPCRPSKFFVRLTWSITSFAGASFFWGRQHMEDIPLSQVTPLAKLSTHPATTSSSLE